MIPIISSNQIINQNLVETTALVARFAFGTIGNLQYREDIELLPTPYARHMATALIQSAAQLQPNYFFAPWISGDECGSGRVTRPVGIRAVWSRPKVRSQVRLIISPDPATKIRIYYEQGEKYAIDYNVSGQIIGGYIKCLCKI